MGVKQANLDENLMGVEELRGVVKDKRRGERASKVTMQKRRQTERCIREVIAGLDPNRDCQLM